MSNLFFAWDRGEVGSREGWGVGAFGFLTSGLTLPPDTGAIDRPTLHFAPPDVVDRGMDRLIAMLGGVEKGWKLLPLILMIMNVM